MEKSRKFKNNKQLMTNKLKLHQSSHRKLLRLKKLQFKKLLLLKLRNKLHLFLKKKHNPKWREL